MKTNSGLWTRIGQMGETVLEVNVKGKGGRILTGSTSLRSHVHGN